MEGLDVIIFFMLSFLVGLMFIWWISDLIGNIRFNKYIAKAKREVSESESVGCRLYVTSGRTEPCNSK